MKAIKSKSDFVYDVHGPVLAIIDLDQGGISVTNDIENVLSEIRVELLEINYPFPPIVIYRDSEQMWDGVEHVGEHLAFYPIQKKDKHKAMEIAKMRWVGKAKGVSL